jgi:small-conductance mechanosensitive channel
MGRKAAMTVSKSVRALLWSATVLAGMIAWRLYSPFTLPRLVDWMSDDVRNLWSRPYFTLGKLPVTPVVLVKWFFFVVLLVVFVRFGRRLLRDRVLKYSSFDRGQRFAIERIFGYLIFTAGLLIGLQSEGINLTTLALLGGTIGIGIGLGLQTIAKNFASGLILLLENPVKVGDRIQIGDLLGDVILIGGRATWVRTNDNVVIIVPNSEFIESRVTNWTANDRRVRIAVPLGVSYGSDPGQVREILLDVAGKHADVLSEPPSDVIFCGFGDSSLDFELRVWTVAQVQTPQVMRSELYFTIFEAFRRRNIEIPFPQRDLHLRSSEIPLPFTPAG